MRQTFSIRFLVRKRPAAMELPQTISVRISLNGERVELATSLKCHIWAWDNKFQRVKGSTKDVAITNNTLYTIRAKINQIYYQQTLHGESTTAQEIKDIFTGKSKKNHYLLMLFQTHNEGIRKQVGVSKSKTTYQKYEITRRHLEGYLKSKSKNDIILDKIDYRFIYEFEIYLKTVARCGHNTTAKFMQFFKRIIIFAHNNGYIKKNPFADYQIKLERVEREYLTMDDLQRLMSKKIDIPRLELIRDLFMFSTFTGLAYIDLKNLRKEHLYASFDGELWIRTTRQKTRETANIRLFEIPKKLIQKYHDSDTEKMFPVPSNQKVNAYLKELADICGIRKELTFHTARHTMATTICLSNGLPIETLAKVLGHSNMKTTQLYARITDVKLRHDMEKLNIQIGEIFKLTSFGDVEIL